MILKADEIDYNRDTEYAEARGHVYYENFSSLEKLYADKAEYQVDMRQGTFYGVHGTSPSKIDARPGLLTTSNPFYFEGTWAERFNNRIILHDGFVTDCKVPRPIWKLTGKKFDIIPRDRAIAHQAIYRLRGVPLFYTPWFPKSLKKVPRKSGFMTPDLTHSSRFGWMPSIGYYWAIDRSYDLTYRAQLLTQRGFAQTFEFRGKPTERSDFDFYLHSVHDNQNQGGYSFALVGRDDLGKGWTARFQINYLSNFQFRQTFTQSFSEAISSETHSTAFVSKHWDSFGVIVDYERDVNFQSTNPGDRILLRKLPEAEFLSRDRQLTKKVIPLWFSFDTSFGFLHRDQPEFETRQYVARADIAPRIMTAFRFKGFSLIPSFGLRSTTYDSSFDTSGRVTGNNLYRNSREVGAEFLLPSLERVYKAPKMFGEKMKHVIEARADYRFVDGVQDFARLVRFDSTELLTNTNEVEVSLTNRLFTKSKDGAVSELMSWQLWQRRYFDPTFGGTVIPGQRNVNLSSIDLTGFAFLDGNRSYSPIVSAFRFQPNRFNFEWRTDYDPRSGNIVDSAVQAGARWSNYNIAFGHNQVREGPVLSPNSNQFTASFGIGGATKRGWNAVLNSFYDYRTQTMTYVSAQVTRNWDCCGLSAQYRRFDFGTRQENQYQFSFSIANLGSFGTLRKQERMF
jgi:LPS-assembly protein